MRPIAFPEIELILKEENEIKALSQHGIINYLKTFELSEFIGFLERIKSYNSRFSKQTFIPEVKGKTKFFSSEFHKNHLDILVKPSTWISLGQVNSRTDEKIQALGSHWLPRMLRSLPSSEALSNIIENNELLELQKLADVACQEARRNKSSDPANRAVYEQILFYLRPFVNLTHFLAEKNRIINDLLARLHVSSYSEDSSVDDIVHYVLSSLNNLNVLGQLKNHINEKQTLRYLKNPHYRGMNETLYSKIIHQIEIHGSERQISSLRRLPIFDENNQHFPTRNFSKKNHMFVVPVFLLDHIPRFKPWPSWLFPNRHFRYQFFQDKHMVLQMMKQGIHENSANLNASPVDKFSIEKMQRALAVLTKESEKVIQEIGLAKAKSSMIFLEKWRNCVFEFKDQLSKKISAESEILQSISMVIPSDSVHPAVGIIQMNGSSINAKSFPMLNVKQKKILNNFFQARSQKEMGHVSLKEISRLLKNARLSFLEMDDYFSMECRRHIENNFFENLGSYLISKSKTNWMLAQADEMRIFLSCVFDYFSLSSEELLKEYQVDFTSQFRKMLNHQLQILCESLIMDYQSAELSREKISGYHRYLRDLLLVTERNPRLKSFVSNLCQELRFLDNPHLLEVKCSAILEGISAKRVSASSLLWKKMPSEMTSLNTDQLQQSQGASL